MDLGLNKLSPLIKSSSFSMVIEDSACTRMCLFLLSLDGVTLFPLGNPGKKLVNLCMYHVQVPIALFSFLKIAAMLTL